MEALNLCPFCGSKAEVYNWEGYYVQPIIEQFVQIKCSQCSCSTPILHYVKKKRGYRFNDRVNLLSEAWNMRNTDNSSYHE